MKKEKTTCLENCLAFLLQKQEKKAIAYSVAKKLKYSGTNYQKQKIKYLDCAKNVKGQGSYGLEWGRVHRRCRVRSVMENKVA